MFDATVAGNEYSLPDIQAMVDAPIDLNTLDSEIADLKGEPETDLYKNLLRSIRSATKETSGSVDVKVTVMGDDTANIVVLQGNRILTERKVRYTHTNN